MRNFLIFISCLLCSASSFAFLDGYYMEKMGSAGAVLAGAEDLISAVDDTAGVLKDVKKIDSAINDVRGILSDVDSVYYDVDYVLSDANYIQDLSSKLHSYADKTRRVLRLAKTLGIITSDAATANALETARLNTLFDNYVQEQRGNKLLEDERRMKKIAFVAKREKIADKSLSDSIQRLKEKDRKSGYAFHPFPIPSGANNVQDNIMSATLGFEPFGYSRLGL